jgi:flagellar motor switch protein FliM
MAKLSARDTTYSERSHYPEGSRTEPQGKAIVTSYDFVHPARVNKAQLGILEELHDNFARLLSGTLCSQLGMVVDVDTTFVDQTTYGEYIESLSFPCCSYQFKLRHFDGNAIGPTLGQAIIDVSLPVVMGYIDRRLGGTGSNEDAQVRQLSQIEMGEIAQLIKQVVEDLESTWRPITRLDVSDIELETHPKFIQVAPAGEIVLLFAFEINSTNMSGMMSICYPFLTIQSLLPLLEQEGYARLNDVSENELMLENRLRLGSASLTASAQMGTAELTVEEAGSLRVGDVIRSGTRTHDPVPVLIEGQPVFLGRPFAADDGTQMIKIAGEIPTGQ